MTVFEQIANNYNYYPTTAIELCVISYNDISAISQAVSDNTNLSVVWGPAQWVDIFDVPYSLMYVASHSATGEYFVVIRGTNFESLYTWLEQDFKIDSSQPFSALPGNPPGAPASALISQGTFNGMTDLISLTDPNTGLSVVEFLSTQTPKYLYVTGHSLGGTLTPPLFAYLNAMLYGGGTISNMALWSFAGLTPGGSGFNDYFNSIIPNNQGFLWRIQNSLDIAPFCWWSEDAIENIYNFNPYYLTWGDAEEASFDGLFYAASVSGIGYEQPQPGLVLPGQFNTGFFDENIWAVQAAYQHHSTTYQQLVNSQYPTT